MTSPSDFHIMKLSTNTTSGRLIVATTLSMLPWLSHADLQVYVSPNGNDLATGLSSNTPVRSLGTAVQIVRNQRAANTSNPATINMAGGRYELASPVMLDPNDSNLTISGPTGNTAIITGGIQITGWSKYIPNAILRRLSPTAARGVYSAAVPAGSLGVFSRRGGAESESNFSNMPAELIVNGSPMSLSRFPATGWARVTQVAHDGLTATMNMARRVATANDAWVQGFWSTEWWQTWERATSAPNTSTVGVGGLANASSLGPIQVGARLAIVNAVEDLNSPGQYYIDRANLRVYFYPPASLGGSLTEISQLDGYLLDAYLSTGLTLKNLVFQASRGQAVQLYACTNSGLDTCTVRSTQLEGILLVAGTNNFVRNCNIHDTGSTGIMSIEGSVATLSPGGDQLTNNTITGPGRLENTDRPAIWIRGVAGTLANNTITQCPGQAIMIEGCNHLVTRNDISHSGTTMNDVGAIYTGQNILNRGTVISDNIIHDSQPTIVPISGATINVGVYLDDFSSGYTVLDNIFYNIEIGMLIGGGRSNTLAGDAFASVTTPLWIDARGKVGETGFFAPGGSYQQQLAAMTPVQTALFLATYPDFANEYYAPDPALPEGNSMSNPYFPSAGIGVLFHDPQYTRSLLAVISDLYNGDTIFVDPANGDFDLVPGAQVTTYLPTTAGASGGSVRGAAASQLADLSIGQLISLVFISARD